MHAERPPTSPPLVVLLAGPNGAGKSTSAPRLLRRALSVEEFVNADVIRPRPLGLSPGSRRGRGWPELALARVAQRVRRGGHGIPDEVVRRRFAAGMRNLFDLYLPLVDSWQVYDNSPPEGPRLIAIGSSGSGVDILDPEAWRHLKAPKT